WATLLNLRALLLHYSLFATRYSLFPASHHSLFAFSDGRGRLRAASGITPDVRARLAGCAPASPRPAHPVPAGRAVPAKAATAGGLLDRREVLRGAGNPRAAAPTLRLGGEGEAGEQQSRCENCGRQLAHVVLR